MLVVMTAVVMTPLMIHVGMGLAEARHVCTMAPPVPMMVVVVITVGVAHGDIAHIESDGDGGRGVGNG